MNFATRKHSKVAGLSLVEVMISLGVLVLVTLSCFTLMSSSVGATRQAKPLFVAQQAAQRIVEELGAESFPLTAFHSKFWKDPANSNQPSATGAVLVNPGALDEHVSLDNWVPTNGNGNQTVFQQVIDPAIGEIKAPGDGGAFIRLTFLNEAEHNALWAMATDLDFDGDANGDGTNMANYQLYSLRVEIHWSDQYGDHAYPLVSAFGLTPPLDSTRN